MWFVVVVVCFFFPAADLLQPVHHSSTHSRVRNIAVLVEECTGSLRNEQIVNAAACFTAATAFACPPLPSAVLVTQCPNGADEYNCPPPPPPPIGILLLFFYFFSSLSLLEWECRVVSSVLSCPFLDRSARSRWSSSSLSTL